MSSLDREEKAERREKSAYGQTRVKQQGAEWKREVKRKKYRKKERKESRKRAGSWTATANSAL